MSDQIPRTSHRWIQFAHGYALGTTTRWHQGQYCSIITPAGIVGCGIYDLKTPAEFNQAIAIAKGTPACPLAEPEDLLDATIVGVTPRAEQIGITVGMTGRQAVEKMQLALPASPTSETSERIQVRVADHITLVVKDLEASRKFYVDLLGMRQVPRPAFDFDGLWFQLGKFQIHLIKEYSGSTPAGNHWPIDKTHTRCAHFAFEVDDAHAVVGLLRKQGVEVLSGPKLRPDGFVQTFLTDPDGHVVELCSPKVAG